MKSNKAMLGIRLSLACWIGLFLTVVASAQQNKIEGQVLDKNNTPLAGVLIKIYRGNTPLPDYRTAADGSYTIYFDPGAPLTSVQYELTNWDMSIVEGISGAKDHKINKILLPEGQARTAVEKRELASTLTRVYDLHKARGGTDQEFKQKYQSLVTFTKLPAEMLAGLPFNQTITVPPEKQNQFQNHLALFNVGVFEGIGRLPDSGAVHFKADIKVFGQQVQGSVATPYGMLSIKEGHFDKNKVSFVVPTGDNDITFDGSFVDDKLVGKIQVEGKEGTFEWAKAEPMLVSYKNFLNSASKGSPLSGSWQATIWQGDTTRQVGFVLEINGSSVQGYFDYSSGIQRIKGSLIGANLLLSVDSIMGNIILKGIVNTGVISGDIEVNGQRQGKWEAKKQEPMKK